MATALETASLVMVPSGYEDGTLGSLQPLDGTGDFTFTRGSNISATRVNEDGYIEKGYENLLLRSNTFDTTWASVRVSESTGFAGYDGADNAWKIVPNTQLGDHRLDQSTSVSGVWTFNIYAKAAGYNFLYILFSGIGNSGKVIDISPNQGVVVDNKGGVQAIDESITDVGNNWWKITLTYSGTLGTLRIITLPANDTSSYAGDGTSGILIQDAQLNQGLVAYPYLETTTTTAKGGILENMPRLDYSGGRCSLLLEPSRTNLSTNSEYTSVSNGAITYNDAISPEGIQNAIKITATSAAFPRFYNTTTFGGGNTYIVSFYVKKGVGDGVGLYGYSNVNYNNVVRFNLDTNEVTYLQTAFSNGYIEDAGNGWKRCVATLTTPSTGSWSGINAVINKANFLQAEVGDEHYFYGMQVEQDATYPTSYIPTYGVSQTKLADNATASSVIDAGDDFTLYFESTRMDYGFTGVYFQATNFGYLSGYTISNTNLRFRYSNVNYGFTASEGVFKYLIRKDSTDMRIYFNGALEYTITTLPAGIGNLNLSGGKIHKTMVFPTALSDEVCIELTTI